MSEAPLTWHYTLRDGLFTLVVDGTLTTASGDLLYEAIIGLLRPDPSRLLIDLSGLVVADESAVLSSPRFDGAVVTCFRSGQG